MLVSCATSCAKSTDDTFRSANHMAIICKCKNELQERKSIINEVKLKSIVVDEMPCDNRMTILRGKDTGQWLLILPSKVNSMELSTQEFRDSLLLHYARSPGDLPSHCDGCGQKFSVRHALECKKGGLVTSRQDEIWDELSDLLSKAFIYPRFATNP